MSADVGAARAATGAGPVQRHWFQLPPPGETYSARSGSSLASIPAELIRQHAAAGGTTTVLVAAGLDHEARGSALLTFESGPDGLTVRQRWADAASALLGGRRRYTERILGPAVRAVPPDFTGPVVLHNAPAAVGILARERPLALPVLYLNNDLFRDYGRRERARIVRQSGLVVSAGAWAQGRLTKGQPRLRRDPKLRVILNGADPEQFRPRPDGTPRPGPVEILFVGRTARNKGPHRLIRACRVLSRRGIDLRLRIIGSAGLVAGGIPTRFERRLRKSADRLGGRVEFVPFMDRTEIGAQFRRADVFCAPSLWPETNALVVAEALNSGLACVVSARGGLPELAGDGATLFRPRRPGDLVRALEPLLRDPARLQEARARGRARGAELTWASRYAELRTAVDDALRRRAAASHPELRETR